LVPDGSWCEVDLATRQVLAGGAPSLWEKVEVGYRSWQDVGKSASPTLKLFGAYDPDRVNPRTGEPGMYVPFHMQQVALMNDEARFGQVAGDRLDDIVAENAERNTDFMKLYFDNTEFQKAIKEAARKARLPDHHRTRPG
jgi:hypothetical protein